MKWKDAPFHWKKSYDQPRQHIKKQRPYLPTKVCLVKAMVFPVVMYGMWDLNHKEGWVPKNWRFWTVVLEKALQSPLDCKKIKPVSAQGNQSWIFIGKAQAEAEIPRLWPPDVELTYWKRPWLIWKYPDAVKDWRQEEKRATEDEMVGWHHQLNGHEFEQAPGDGEGQGGLACYSPWSHKESDSSEGLNNNN